MQSHRIFDQSSMPASISDESNDEESYELCEKHPNEFIKYFCSKHDSLICGHCLAFHHRSCNVYLITELCKSEYGSVNKDIVDLLTDVDEYASDIESNMDLVTQLSKAEVLKLREYRDGIDKYFEQRMGFLLENIQLMKDKDETLLDSLKPKCDRVKSRVETVKSRLSLLESNPAKLFIETKRAQTELVGLRSTLAEIKKEKIIHEYRFEKDSITEKLLASKTGLGTMTEKHVAPLGKQLLASCCCITKELVLLVAIVIIGIIVPVVVIRKGDQTVNSVDLTSLRYTRDSDITVNGYTSDMLLLPENRLKIKAAKYPFLAFTGDQTVNSVDLTSLRYTRDSDITVNGYTSDMLLLPENRLILADWSNEKVELIDMRTNDLMFEVRLPGRPHRMAILPGDRLAVCFQIQERIQFLKTLGQFSLEENIKVHGKCSGIGYHKDRLVVSYICGKVEIMDMTGNVIKTIDKNANGQPIFGHPLYLQVVSDFQTAVIYVSDRDKSTITKLDMDLNIIQTFRDPALRGPKGITAVGNQLLICGSESNNIMCLDLPSGQMNQLLVGKVEGIEYPRTVCYDHQQNKMYLSLDTDGSVKVYKAE